MPWFLKTPPARTDRWRFFVSSFPSARGEQHEIRAAQALPLRSPSGGLSASEFARPVKVMWKDSSGHVRGSLFHAAGIPVARGVSPR